MFAVSSTFGMLAICAVALGACSSPASDAAGGTPAAPAAAATSSAIASSPAREAGGLYKDTYVCVVNNTNSDLWRSSTGTMPAKDCWSGSDSDGDVGDGIGATTVDGDQFRLFGFSITNPAVGAPYGTAGDAHEAELDEGQSVTFNFSYNCPMGAPNDTGTGFGTLARDSDDDNKRWTVTVSSFSNCNRLH